MTRLWPSVLVGWGLAALIILLVSVQAIAGLWFPDPDDAMRMLEVRDWLAGQSWWDVGQHRLNGGDFAMHWSRLVDLPIAAVMLVFDPLVGQAASTRVALVMVPLATLLIVMALAAVLTRRLAGLEPAKLAILLAPLSAPLLYQLRPLRVDHHGWQIACALAAAVVLIARPTARNGASLGAILAVLVTISLEGLPITAAMIGVAVLAWIVDPTRRAQVAAMMAALFAGVVLLHVATRGPAMFAAACDAIAPGWIAALGVAALGLIGAALVSSTSLAGRIMLATAASGAGLATLVTVAPDCTQGPFATLDPLVRDLWYLQVREGLPVWDQYLAWGLINVSLPVVGLVGGVMALRDSTGDDRVRWAMMLMLASAAFALSLLVVRAGATANAFAIPGAAWALLKMLERARAVRSIGKRLLATAGAFAAASPGSTMGAVLIATGLSVSPATATTGASGATAGRPGCKNAYQVAALGQIPPARLFAPIDVSPQIIAVTGHHAIGGGYHRNPDAIATVFKGFLADPAEARRIVTATGAAFVVGCPGLNETEMFKVTAPNGLWARLERGERVHWLEPVAIAGSAVLAWRVVDPARRPLPGAPAAR